MKVLGREIRRSMVLSSLGAGAACVFVGGLAVRGRPQREVLAVDVATDSFARARPELSSDREARLMPARAVDDLVEAAASTGGGRGKHASHYRPTIRSASSLAPAAAAPAYAPPAPAPSLRRRYGAMAIATPALAVTSAAARAPGLDPNARYATTYRPGGAALAAFDAALERGAIPAAYRDLVGDFGARYAPSLAPPAAGALAVRVDAERSALPPAGGPLHLRVALRSAAGRQLARARLAVTVALDISGSMQGQAIVNARDALATLVGRLDDADDFALVTFSDQAQVLIPAGALGPRRRRVLQRIAAIDANGGTNIGAGLDMAYAQARAQRGRDAQHVVMLLSDGQANAGDTNPASLADRCARAFQEGDGVQTSAFGLGDDFDAHLLGAFADRGAGGYYYLANASEIAPAFARELDARLVPAALAVEVRVRLRADVVPSKVYGSRALDQQEAALVRQQEIASDVDAQRRHGMKRDRRDDATGGMRFFIPSFARDDHYALLLDVQVPAGVGDGPIGRIEVRYKDRLLGKNVTSELPVRLRYARSDADSAATLDAGVLRTVQAFAAGDAILEAVARVDQGDRRAAARLLRERALLLAGAAKQLGEPRFSDDSQRLARLAGAVDGVTDPLALALLLRGSGAGYLQ